MEKIIFVAGVGLGTAIGGAILWVAFWTILIPEAFSTTWTGYDSLTVAIFMITGLAGALAAFVSSLK